MTWLANNSLKRRQSQRGLMYDEAELRSDRSRWAPIPNGMVIIRTRSLDHGDDSRPIM